MLAGLYREFFRALSNPTRFRIVELLRERPRYVGEIAEALVVEQSRVSHNLACLLNCGFVQWQWKDRNKVYSLNPQLAPVLGAIDSHLLRYGPALKCCGVLEAEEAKSAHPRRARKGTLGKRPKRIQPTERTS